MAAADFEISAKIGLILPINQIRCGIWVRLVLCHARWITSMKIIAACDSSKCVKLEVWLDPWVFISYCLSGVQVHCWVHDLPGTPETGLINLGQWVNWLPRLFMLLTWIIYTGTICVTRLPRYIYYSVELYLDYLIYLSNWILLNKQQNAKVGSRRVL